MSGTNGIQNTKNPENAAPSNTLEGTDTTPSSSAPASNAAEQPADSFATAQKNPYTTAQAAGQDAPPFMSPEAKAAWENFYGVLIAQNPNLSKQVIANYAAAQKKGDGIDQILPDFEQVMKHQPPYNEKQINAYIEQNLHKYIARKFEQSDNFNVIAMLMRIMLESVQTTNKLAAEQNKQLSRYNIFTDEISTYVQHLGDKQTQLGDLKRGKKSDEANDQHVTVDKTTFPNDWSGMDTTDKDRPKAIKTVTPTEMDGNSLQSEMNVTQQHMQRINSLKDRATSLLQSYNQTSVSTMEALTNFMRNAYDTSKSIIHNIN